MTWSYFDKETTTEPSLDADVIVGKGILAALGEDLSSDVRAAAEEAVATAVIAADLSLQVQAQDAVTEAAADQAIEAAVNIKEETTRGVERSANEIAGDALREDVTRAAALIIDSAIENLEVEGGTLDQKDVVSDAAADAVFEAFGEEAVQIALEPLELTEEEEERLQKQAAEELASNLVTSSDEAAQVTVEELPPAVADTLLTQVTERFSGAFNEIITYIGSLGIGSLIFTFVVSGIATAIRRPLVKLKASSGTRLRYAVAASCTIEDVRLERPVSVFRNVVSKGEPINEAFPCFLDAGAGEMEFQFSQDYDHTYTWNLQLLWLRAAPWLFGAGQSWSNFTYALRVNGRWQSYPIERGPENSSTAASGDLHNNPRTTRLALPEDSDDKGA